VVAFPEEFFFRGFVEEAFSARWPTPKRLFGVSFGLASLMTASLFALSHSLIALRWWHIFIFFPALLFSWLRQKTGTIWASVVFHAFQQITNTEVMKLFRSHRPDYDDGMQLRDFIYVEDVIKVLMFLMQKRPESGIYNLGTGKAETFLDLSKAVFAALKKKVKIEFIDTPEDIRSKYQYFTEAKMKKLIRTGYHGIFTDIQSGINDYVRNYLSRHAYF
jgi:nucleoside-diphosphate-sugar epimerase